MEAAFYGSLLGIQATLVGIISAVVFVYLQLSFGNVPTSQIGLLFKDSTLRIFTAIESASILVTAIGWMFLSAPTHNFVPAFDLHSNDFFLNPITMGACLVLTFSGILPFAIFVVKYFDYLHPSRVLLIALNRLAPRQVELYLYKISDVNPPNRRMAFDNLTDQELRAILATDAEEVVGGHLTQKFLQAQLPVEGTEVQIPWRPQWNPSERFLEEVIRHAFF
jgi:hypothetical protein